MFRPRTRVRSAGAAIAAAVGFTMSASTAVLAETPSGPPITIGFSMPLTGGLAVNGTSGLLAMQIWAEDTNAKGGLLGRPVKLDYYDDQTNPSLVPGIYTKLLDVDKVDLVVSGYGTNVTAPALPVVIQHNMNVHRAVRDGRQRGVPLPEILFDAAGGAGSAGGDLGGVLRDRQGQQGQARLEDDCLAVDDGEATRNTADGARVNVKKAGLDVVYDKTYPPTTTDFTPIIRAIQATNPDIVYIASYPPDSVGLIRACTRSGSIPRCAAVL